MDGFELAMLTKGAQRSSDLRMKPVITLVEDRLHGEEMERSARKLVDATGERGHAR